MKALKNFYLDDFVVFFFKKKYFSIITIIISVSLFYIFSLTLPKQMRIFVLVDTNPSNYFFEKMNLFNLNNLNKYQSQSYKNFGEYVSDLTIIRLNSKLNVTNFQKNYFNNLNLSTDKKLSLIDYKNSNIVVEKYNIQKLKISNPVKVSLVYNANLKNPDDYLKEYISFTMTNVFNEIKETKKNNIDFSIEVLKYTKQQNDILNLKNDNSDIKNDNSDNSIFNILNNKENAILLLKSYADNIDKLLLDFNYIIDEGLNPKEAYLKLYQLLLFGFVFGLTVALFVNFILFIKSIRS